MKELKFNKKILIDLKPINFDKHEKKGGSVWSFCETCADGCSDGASCQIPCKNN